MIVKSESVFQDNMDLDGRVSREKPNPLESRKNAGNVFGRFYNARHRARRTCVGRITSVTSFPILDSEKRRRDASISRLLEFI